MHWQQGGEVWASFELLNAFGRFSGGFEPFLGSVCHRSDRSWSPVSPVRGLVLFTYWAPVWPVVVTGLTGQSWADAAALFSSTGLHAFIQGELACVQRELFVVFELWFGDLRSLLEHSFVSDVSSRCPCLRGPRIVFFKWSCSLPLFGFRSLVRVSFYSFLFLLFLPCYYFWVLSMHLSRGRLKTMCGSRTGGWSLPGVMSDWQHCVDWFLAKYCRCRLRLDGCWCRWRTSAKGHRWWGLRVWRRQVSFIRGTRWPAESTAGGMVAWIARWSHGRFLGWASKPRSSRDYVGDESWVAIGGGYTEFAGFPVVHQKTTGFLGWSTKPRPKNQRRRCSSFRPVWPVGTGLTGEVHQSDRCATTQSRIFKAEDTRRDREACVEAKQVAITGHPSDGAMTKISDFAIEGHVSLIS
jgi:hypothetical protein